MFPSVHTTAHKMSTHRNILRPGDGQLQFKLFTSLANFTRYSVTFTVFTHYNLFLELSRKCAENVLQSWKYFLAAFGSETEIIIMQFIFITQVREYYSSHTGSLCIQFILSFQIGSF